MQIVEEFIKGKRQDQEKCEDGYIIKPQLVAVIDGVTSKGNHLWEGKHQSGCFAMRKIKEFLEGDIESLNAYELFSRLSNHLKSEYEKEMCEEIPEEKLRACIIVYNAAYGEVWAYGDCQCMINSKLYENNKLIDDIISQKRVSILKDALKNGMTEEELLLNDVGRKVILEDIKELFSYENKKCEFGYPVLNGGEIVCEMIKKYPVPEGAEVVLASDGYPALCDTLAESEKELKRLVKEDPLCIFENPSSKGVTPGFDSFDDRCYVKFKA